MTTYFVTRHAGAREWAARRGIEATVVEHLDPALPRPGDTVLGTLPAQLVAEINARGVRYGHLAIVMPPDERGKDLSADDLERLGARLIEISAFNLGPFAPRPVRPPGSAFGGLGRRWRRFSGGFRRWLGVSRWRIGWALATAVFVMLAAVPGATSVILTEAWNCATKGACDLGWWSALIAASGVALIVFAAAFAILSVVARTVVWSRLREVAPREERCRVLIMGLSDLPPEQLAALDDIKAAFADGPERYARVTADYLKLPMAGGPDDLRRLAIKWQQNVRACHQHGEALAAAFVLPSDKSFAQWDAFKDFMHHFFPELALELVVDHKGRPFLLPRAPGKKDRDYEEYAYVWSGLSRAVDQAHEYFADRQLALADDEICIDVTAGQKTFSMAGANVTLNRELKLSYVSNDGAVTVYNAEVDTADALRRVLNAGGAGL